MNLNQKQRDFYQTKKTRGVDFRLLQLKHLKTVLQRNEKELYDALKKDLNKSEEESFLTELSIVYSEIDHHIKCLKKWSRPQKVKTNLLNIPARSEVIYEPYGVALIFGAWNYPVNLTLMPLIGAMSAGNTVVLKPSELAINVSNALAKMINENFEEGYVHVVEGGAETATDLLKEKWDYVFYTGGERVGKIIAKACAEHLTPCTLELGGKSPCILMDDVDLKLSVKRILWGKFLNAGQTCIAPDYLLVPEKFKAKVLEELKNQIQTSYIPEVKIINDGHLKRLKGLVENPYYQHIVEGEQRLGPVVIDVTDAASMKVMQEEIFGPLIPVVGFHDLDQAISFIETKPRPLALYLFTSSEQVKERVMQVSFGGGVINDVIMHISNPYLPFGGVGTSGMGAYHGQWSFESFSHRKSVMTKPLWFDPFIKYPPYTDLKMRLLKLLVK